MIQPRKPRKYPEDERDIKTDKELARLPMEDRKNEVRPRGGGGGGGGQGSGPAPSCRACLQTGLPVCSRAPASAPGSRGFTYPLGTVGNHIFHHQKLRQYVPVGRDADANGKTCPCSSGSGGSTCSSARRRTAPRRTAPPARCAFPNRNRNRSYFRCYAWWQPRLCTLSVSWFDVGCGQAVMQTGSAWRVIPAGMTTYRARCLTNVIRVAAGGGAGGGPAAAAVLRPGGGLQPVPVHGRARRLGRPVSGPSLSALSLVAACSSLPGRRLSSESSSGVTPAAPCC